MQPIITYNDAWESLPLELADDVIDYFNRELQPTHPLRAFKLFPVAKCWRKDKYLVEEEEPSDNLWVLDMHRKKRIRGKTCYYFTAIQTVGEGSVKAGKRGWLFKGDRHKPFLWAMAAIFSCRTTRRMKARW
jgi:hypothetical protein